MRFFCASKCGKMGTSIGLKKHRREWLDNFVPPMNQRKFERVEGVCPKMDRPPAACGYWFPIFEKPILVKHFCATNVGCSFLSRQSRFPDLEGKRHTILSTVQCGQKWPGSEPLLCFGVMVRADFSAVRGLRSFAQPPGVVNFNAAQRCTSSFGHGFGDCTR